MEIFSEKFVGGLLHQRQVAASGGSLKEQGLTPPKTGGCKWWFSQGTGTYSTKDRWLQVVVLSGNRDLLHQRQVAASGGSLREQGLTPPKTGGCKWWFSQGTGAYSTKDRWLQVVVLSGNRDLLHQRQVAASGGSLREQGLTPPKTGGCKWWFSQNRDLLHQRQVAASGGSLREQGLTPPKTGGCKWWFSQGTGAYSTKDRWLQVVVLSRNKWGLLTTKDRWLQVVVLSGNRGLLHQRQVAASGGSLKEQGLTPPKTGGCKRQVVVLSGNRGLLHQRQVAASGGSLRNRDLLHQRQVAASGGSLREQGLTPPKTGGCKWWFSQGTGQVATPPKTGGFKWWFSQGTGAYSTKDRWLQVVVLSGNRDLLHQRQVAASGGSLKEQGLTPPKTGGCKWCLTLTIKDSF
ncbi:unnamed protein product [Mytilus edulis]|uniref:Uncharacterized protein n=1 Tax=Mytilus edulis TaxID=6550 RepID=A0A8S3S3N7_MYTED|nr:unnamed protein product [Mytilus edulis]